ncbi:MAG: hypothetical protein ISR65_00995 [Bacteriovoracaceae bacterium]|nr:hypothetical protein [Bacteriovoracaceae bacterium]
MLYTRWYQFIITCVILMLFVSSSYGASRVSRLGIGISTQLTNDLPAISFKFQRSKSFALGGITAISTKKEGGGYSVGLKLYRVLFDEPQLNFYAAVMGALMSITHETTENESGFQVNFTVGSEFHFAGLDSIGFSFECGFSINKLATLDIETVGYNFLTAGIHFYL